MMRQAQLTVDSALGGCVKRRVTAGLVGLVMLAAILSGCGGSSPVQSRAETVPEAAVGTPSAALPAAADLTRKQAAAALLSVQDLPTGWAEDDATDAAGEPQATYSPRACSKMGGSEKNRVTLGKTSFSESGVLGATLTEEIYLPRGSTPKARLASLRDAMTECRSYSVKDKSGTTKLKLSALSFPVIGDGTLAVHGKVETPTITATDDVIYVAVESVIVRLDSVSIASGMPGTELERLGRLAVKRVQQAH